MRVCARACVLCFLCPHPSLCVFECVSVCVCVRACACAREIHERIEPVWMSGTCPACRMMQAQQRLKGERGGAEDAFEWYPDQGAQNRWEAGAHTHANTRACARGEMCKHSHAKAASMLGYLHTHTCSHAHVHIFTPLLHKRTYTYDQRWLEQKTRGYSILRLPT